MLRFSRLALDGEEMTDDQRDALCNMGESLGLTGGEAEDLIDEYLDQVSGMPVAAPAAPPLRRSVPAAAQPATPAKAAAPAIRSAPAVAPPRESQVQSSPLARAQEKQKYPPFTNSVGAELLLVTSGSFKMGSTGRDATPQEQPITPVTLTCFYMARFPVTNAQYERFDPSHRAKRAQWADDRHPVVYVSSRDAEKFCAWLSSKEGRRYRLPTEAEWEFAARGTEERLFPWGDSFGAEHFANFADKRTSFAWRDATIDDGYAESSPVGTYPRGASPFGIEDMAGNVFEWCLDYFEPYRGKEKVNPRGPATGAKRVYRGGSWKSRVGSLRTTARNSNVPEYSSNDVGFRVVCECS
jgi:formylglycine-generating enzyme required for sulfatase activity